MTDQMTDQIADEPAAELGGGPPRQLAQSRNITPAQVGPIGPRELSFGTY